MKRIEELSKDELLGLIYHAMPRTLAFDHPCICVGCGTLNPSHLVQVNGTVVVPFAYICDRCESDLS